MPPGEYCDGASEHGNALEGLPAAGEGRECQMSDEVKVTTQVSSPGARVREPPDGGYGWVIVFATVMLGITIGAKYVSFGVFLLEFSEFLDLPQADISLLASIDMIAFTVVSLISGPLSNILGARPVAMIGLCLSSAGLAIAAFSTGFYMLTITFSLMKGLGSGLLIIPIFVIVQEYFTTKRAAAAAIASCGMSCGALLFGPILQALVDAMGWRGALLTFAGINFQLMVFAALLRPVSPTRKPSAAALNKSENVSATGVATNIPSRPCHDACLKILREALSSFNLSLLKDIDCVLYFIGRCIAMLGLNSMYMFAITRAVYLGVDPLAASFITTCIGVASTVARLVMALLTSHLKVNHLLVYVVSATLSGILGALSSLAGGEVWHHMLFAAAFGICLGTFDSLSPTVATDVCGLPRLASFLAMVMFGAGITGFATLPLIGLMFDIYKNYIAAFILFCGLHAVGTTISGLLLILRRRQRNKQQQQADATMCVRQDGGLDATDEQSIALKKNEEEA